MKLFLFGFTFLPQNYIAHLNLFVRIQKELPRFPALVLVAIFQFSEVVVNSSS